ncbi:MAG: hypothetical protein AAF991_00650 [Pseudomonadota bacterium]
MEPTIKAPCKLVATRVPDGLDEKMLRLFVLGAINSTRTWYRPGGNSPNQIGRQFVRLLRSVV